jgi:DNA-binding XRE family transcriptional regulator
MLVIGTGGNANPQMINAGPSGPLVVPVVRIASTEVESDRLFDTHEKLAGIRRYLSMNVSDLAKALRVRRPTVYAWLKGNPQLRRNHAQRLEAMYKIAKKWRMISSKPVGAFLNPPETSGVSLLKLLSSRVLDHDEISASLLQIREAVAQPPARLSVLEAAKRRNLKLSRKQTVNWASNEGIDV